MGGHRGLTGDADCRGHCGSRAMEHSHIILLEYLIICWETTVGGRKECLRSVVPAANTLLPVCRRKTTSDSMLSSLLFMKKAFKTWKYPAFSLFFHKDMVGEGSSMYFVLQIFTDSSVRIFMTTLFITGKNFRVKVG